MSSTKDNNKIQSITARKILNSQGDWTIEVTIDTENSSATAGVPEGISKGIFEAQYVEPEKAIEQIANIIEPALKGKNLRQVDDRLLQLDLGANAKIGVSIAAAKIQSVAPKGTPPKLYINVIEGGVHASASNLDFQEYLVIPKADTIAEQVEIGREVYQKLKEQLKAPVGDEGGFVANFKNNLEPFELLQQFSNIADFGLDAAANNVSMSSDELVLLYKQMPIVYLEDPFGENDFENFAKLRADLPDVVIAGDDLTTTNLERMKKAKDTSAINGVVIKPNQIGTIQQAMEAIKQGKEWGWNIIVSHRGGETNDDFIADFAWAMGADGVKLGGLARGERIAKYNRLLEIEK